MLPTEIRDNVEEPGVGAFWVTFQDARVDVLWSRKHIGNIYIYAFSRCFLSKDEQKQCIQVATVTFDS